MLARGEKNNGEEMSPSIFVCVARNGNFLHVYVRTRNEEDL